MKTQHATRIRVGVEAAIADYTYVVMTDDTPKVRKFRDSLTDRAYVRTLQMSIFKHKLRMITGIISSVFDQLNNDD